VSQFDQPPMPADVPAATAARFDQARELVRAVAVAANNAALYPASHPLVEEASSGLVTAVDDALGRGGDEVTINLFKSTLFVEDHVLPDESVTYARLVEDLLSRGISAVTFTRGFGREDARALMDVVTADGVQTVEAAREVAERAGATHLVLSETAQREDPGAAEARRAAKAAARAEYDRGVEAMRDVETRIKLGKAFEVAPLEEVVSGLLDKLFQDPAAILGLTAIKGHDDYTLGHAINVCILALSLGASLQLGRGQLESLGLSALLYDIGKVRIPEEILTKRGPLSAEEWEIVKGHAVAGADLLANLQITDRMPMVVAYEHHLRHDLQGYPSGPGAGEQHLFSRVVAICDAYDAMTTRRPFRREIRPDKAIAVVMQGRGKAYDPQLTKSFVALLGIYPMGAVVKLDEGSTAVVFRVNGDDLLRPKVKLLADPEGRWAEDPEVVDLRLMNPRTGTYEASIVECVPALDAGVEAVWEYL
jgi:HD-GYP domain-containing protein (c-di-GMP phosphodiesterase class II)